MKNKILRIICGIMFLISCGSCSVIITDIPSDLLQKDPFNLEGIEIVEDTIILSVTYGGGCKDHYFALFMSPAAFLESYPVQANLYLWHNSNGDACEALINENISFNLRPIAELYKSTSGQLNEIIINVFEYKSTNKISASYFL